MLVHSRPASVRCRLLVVYDLCTREEPEFEDLSEQVPFVASRLSELCVAGFIVRLDCHWGC